MELQPKTRKVYKSIWLRTKDAIVSNERINFNFNNFAVIQVRGNAILKVNSVSFAGDIHSADGHNWVVKLDDVKFEKNQYYNSDKINIPTICQFNFDTKQTIQHSDFALQLLEQDINSITLKIFSDETLGDPIHGLLKNSKIIEMIINLIIEETHTN